MIGTVAAVFLAFCGLTVRLFIVPASGMPARVDAIVMMAGPGDRYSTALRLAAEHRAPVLVISRGLKLRHQRALRAADRRGPGDLLRP